MEPDTNFEPGVAGIYRIPAHIYHAAPGFSNSMASNMDPPARLPVYLTKKREVTTAMILGTLIHQRILEPESPMPRLILQPEKYPGGKNGEPIKWHNGAKYCQAWHEEQEKAGRIVLTATEMDNLVGCIDAIRSEPMAAALFSGRGESELSFFTEMDGVLLKSRLDYIPPKSVVNGLVDIKKVQEGNAERESFIELAVRRGYHRQAAAYLDAYNYWFPEDQREHFIFVVVEEQAPHLVNVIPMGRNTIEAGRELNRRRRMLYKQCLDSDIWPGYPVIMSPIEARPYLLEREF